MSRTVVQAFASAASALTREHDVIDLLSRLVRDCADLLSADVVGILIATAQGQLELLSSTSHRIADLEMFQTHRDTGPSVEAIQTSGSVSVVGVDEIRTRWPEVGGPMIEAGFVAVQAHPLSWRGQLLGAMTIFYLEPGPIESAAVELGQTFADVATLAIVHSADLAGGQVASNVAQVLAARTEIERAKGVLAFQGDVDMAVAYDQLLRLVGPEFTLSQTAADVIARAQDRTDTC